MSNVSVLRDRMAWREKTFPGLSTTRVDNSYLAALLDIAEAVAARVIEYELCCPYCDGGPLYRADASLIGYDHAPDCPYIRARELCGMEQDGAE